MTDGAFAAEALGRPSASPWPRVAISDVARTSSGTTPSRRRAERYFAGGTVPWVKTLDLRNGEISATDECVTDLAVQETSLQVYPPGTVLVAMYGGFNQIGRTGLLRIPACVNQALSAIQVNRNRVVPEYLLAVLNFRVEHWKAVASSSRKDPNITGSDVRAFELPLPSMEEQRSVAAALSDVEALLAKLDQLFAKKRDVKQAAMQQLLTGRLRLQGFTRRWDDRKLASLGSLLKGRGVTRNQANSGSIACVRYGEIYTTHHDIVRGITSWISPTVAATATRLKCGDILFAGSGETKEEIGKCVAFIDDFEAYAGGDIVILRPRGVDARFLGYALNTPEVNRQKANFGQGDAVVHISAAALGSVTVRLPPLDEQVAIGTVLADMDAELAALEARRDKTRRLKQGMMQALLTGRIRLT